MCPPAVILRYSTTAPKGILKTKNFTKTKVHHSSEKLFLQRPGTTKTWHMGNSKEI